MLLPGYAAAAGLCWAGLGYKKRLGCCAVAYYAQYPPTCIRLISSLHAGGRK